MDFAYAPQVEALRQRVKAFMDDHVVPQIAASCVLGGRIYLP